MLAANIITVYKQPKLVETLLRTMRHPGIHFYLHIDRKADIRQFEYLAELPNVFFMNKRFDIKWAGYSIIEALVYGMRQALNSGHSYHFITHLSGQCLPLKPVDELYDYYNSNRGKIFLSCSPAPNAWWTEALQRIESYHFHQFDFPGKYRLGSLISRFLPKRKSPGLELYGGPHGAYWTLTPDAARYICEVLQNNRKVIKFFKYVWGPDEILVNSLIMNSPFRSQVINKTDRYIDWSAGGGHPKTLTTADFDRIINSGCLYARKFDMETDPKAVALLENYLYVRNSHAGPILSSNSY